MTLVPLYCSFENVFKNVTFYSHKSVRHRVGVTNFPTCQTQRQTQTDEVTGLSRRPRTQISFFFLSNLTIYLKKIFFFLAVPHSLWNLSSPTRD